MWSRKPPRYQPAFLQQRKRTLLQPWWNSWAPRVLGMLLLLRHYPVPSLPQPLLDHRDQWTRLRLLQRNLLKRKTSNRLFSEMLFYCDADDYINQRVAISSERKCPVRYSAVRGFYMTYISSLWRSLIALRCVVNACVKTTSDEREIISRVWMQFHSRIFRELNWLISVKTSTLLGCWARLPEVSEAESREYSFEDLCR